MKFVILIIGLCPSLLSSAQDAQGIRFQQGLKWEQIKEKAKAERKLIFVDCYATWCGPCKEMDKQVYPNEEAAHFVNENFISVKVQMDSTNRDDENVKLTYATAREFERKYKITGLPTFLFFSSEGQLVHRDIGYKSVLQFSKLVKDASNPGTQLYTLFQNAMSGKVNQADFPIAIQKVKKLDEDSLYLLMCRHYIEKYLTPLSEKDYLSNANLEFFNINSAVVSSKDRIFKYYMVIPVTIDSLMGHRGYTREKVFQVIQREEIEPVLVDYERNEIRAPWYKIIHSISRKYGRDYAKSSELLLAKASWCNYKKEWVGYVKTIYKLWEIKKSEFSSYSPEFLNGCAWKTVVHSKNKKYLRAALAWINIALSNPEYASNIGLLDTKANIEYQLGMKKEAIAIETQVLQITKETLYNSPQEKENWIKYFEGFIDKMSRGQRIELQD